MIDVQPADLQDLLILRTKVFSDARGYFTETYNRKAFIEAGIIDEFVQDNASLSIGAVSNGTAAENSTTHQKTLEGSIRLDSYTSQDPRV